LGKIAFVKKLSLYAHPLTKKENLYRFGGIAMATIGQLSLTHRMLRPALLPLLWPETFVLPKYMS
jgi:hypothetical protein